MPALLRPDHSAVGECTRWFYWPLLVRIGSFIQIGKTRQWYWVRDLQNIGEGGELEAIDVVEVVPRYVTLEHMIRPSSDLIGGP
jgi:hypothetical protein